MIAFKARHSIAPSFPPPADMRPPNIKMGEPTRRVVRAILLPRRAAHFARSADTNDHSGGTNYC